MGNKRILINGVEHDYHHILYQAKYWKQGYAKELREHPYCGAYIPKYTLHRELHAKIHDIPTPNGKDCRMAIEWLNCLLDNGEIHISDPLNKKIAVIAHFFRPQCPATVAVLDWQREVVEKFYARGD